VNFYQQGQYTALEKLGQAGLLRRMAGGVASAGRGVRDSVKETGGDIKTLWHDVRRPTDPLTALLIPPARVVATQLGVGAVVGGAAGGVAGDAVGGTGGAIAGGLGGAALGALGGRALGRGMLRRAITHLNERESRFIKAMNKEEYAQGVHRDGKSLQDAYNRNAEAGHFLGGMNAFYLRSRALPRRKMVNFGEGELIAGL